jgi:hypothetical protein
MNMTDNGVATVLVVVRRLTLEDLVSTHLPNVNSHTKFTSNPKTSLSFVLS